MNKGINSSLLGMFLLIHLSDNHFQLFHSLQGAYQTVGTTLLCDPAVHVTLSLCPINLNS